MLDETGLDQRIWKQMLNFIAHFFRRFLKGTVGPGLFDEFAEQRHSPQSGVSTKFSFQILWLFRHMLQQFAS